MIEGYNDTQINVKYGELVTFRGYIHNNGLLYDPRINVQLVTSITGFYQNQLSELVTEPFKTSKTFIQNIFSPKAIPKSYSDSVTINSRTGNSIRLRALPNLFHLEGATNGVKKSFPKRTKEILGSWFSINKIGDSLTFKDAFPNPLIVKLAFITDLAVYDLVISKLVKSSQESDNTYTKDRYKINKGGVTYKIRVENLKKSSIEARGVYFIDIYDSNKLSFISNSINIYSNQSSGNSRISCSLFEAGKVLCAMEPGDELFPGEYIEVTYRLKLSSKISPGSNIRSTSEVYSTPNYDIDDSNNKSISTISFLR